MSKEWILNHANMRWGLTKKDKVGPVAELIRKCAPKTVKEWEEFYFSNVYPREHLENLGRKLFIKITDVLRKEIEDITEEDCINYIYNLVINRTFEGYQTEIRIIYEQLEHLLNVKIYPAPDEWDRKYNVDYYIKVRDKFIGLQIKPAIPEHIPQIINERKQQRRTHDKFTEKYGGKVFYIISITEGENKKIYNTEVIEEIKREIERLEKE